MDTATKIQTIRERPPQPPTQNGFGLLMRAPLTDTETMVLATEILEDISAGQTTPPREFQNMLPFSPRNKQGINLAILDYCGLKIKASSIPTPAQTEFAKVIVNASIFAHQLFLERGMNSKSVLPINTDLLNDWEKATGQSYTEIAKDYRISCIVASLRPPQPCSN